MADVLSALALLFEPSTFIMCFVGMLVGVILGAIPGLAAGLGHHGHCCPSLSP